MAAYTTLAAAMGKDDQSIVVTSATGAATGNTIIIDGEQMVQSGPAVSTLIPVQRGGKGGTVQSAHAILAPVLMGSATEIQGPAPTTATVLQPGKKVITSYAVNGAITPPTVDTVVFLTKATAAAMTLASPTAGTPDGVVVTIYSTTAAAHTVTYTPGFAGNTTSSDVATFAATIGSSLTIMSARGVWGILASNGITVA